MDQLGPIGTNLDQLGPIDAQRSYPRLPSVDLKKNIMSLQKAQKAKIDAAIASNNEPRFINRTGRLILPTGGKNYVSLATSDSKLTPQGKYFFEKTGKTPPVNQQVIREGAKEYIMVNGKRKMIRSWSAEESDFKYTKIGKGFFKNTLEEFLVHIPVVINGRNKKTGRAYQRFGHLPHLALEGLQELKVPVHLSQSEKDAKIKQMVLDGINTENIFEVSDEKYALWDEGTWRISKLETRTLNGEPQATAVINRPLQAGQRIYSFSHLHKSWAFSDASFEDSKNCVCHQLSTQLGISCDEIAEFMDTCQEKLYADDTDVYGHQHWSKLGITAAMIIEFAKSLSFSCHIM